MGFGLWVLEINYKRYMKDYLINNINRVLTRIELMFERQAVVRRNIGIFLLMLLTNFAMFYLVYLNEQPDAPFLTAIRGDAIDFINLSENFKDTGIYGLEDPETGEVKSRVVRMPGFFIFYFPLTYLFGMNIAVNLLIIIQTILSALAKTLTLSLVKRYTNFRVFLIGVLLLIIANPINQYNNILYTESLASSLIVFIVFLFVTDFKRFKRKNSILIAGLIFCILVFLRPFFLPFAALFVIYLWVEFKIEIKKFVVIASLFVFPLLLGLTGWVIRNYIVFDEFILLERYYEPGDSTLRKETRSFIKRFGGMPIEWSSTAAGTFFAEESFLEKHNIKRPDKNIFPDYIFTETLTIDSLLVVQQAFNNLAVDTLSDEYIDAYNERASKIIDMFDNALRENRPFQYYVLTRYASVKASFYLPWSNYKSTKYPYNVLLLFVNSMVSILLLTIGGIMSVYYFLKNAFNRGREIKIFFISSIVVLMIFILNLIMRNFEGRAIITLYYLISILAFVGYNSLLTTKYGKFVLLLILLASIVFSVDYVLNALVW